MKSFSGIERPARLKLDRLEAALALQHLAVISIDDSWRICFEWPASAAGPSKVEIVDYY